MRRRLRGIALYAIATGLFFSTGVAVAHSGFYGPKWRDGTTSGINMDKVVDWRFVDNFPTGDGSRSRTQDGSQEWNKMFDNGTASMRFHFESAQPDATTLNWEEPCPAATQSQYQRDKVGQGDFGNAGFSLSEPLARVKTCVFAADTSDLFLFKVKLNNDAPVFTGTGDPPAGRWDLWGIMAHEFGHAAGRLRGGPDGNGHFGEGWDVCPGASNLGGRHTMCPSIFDGTPYARSLAAHDKDSHQNAYP